jgi:hypothetical protein
VLYAGITTITIRIRRAAWNIMKPRFHSVQNQTGRVRVMIE